jgi:hypothetical protein
MDQNDPVAPGSAGGGPVITSDPERAPSAGAAGVVPSFLAELTRAMQAAAERQREEIANVIDDDAAGQVEIARKRGAAEAGELRRAAERDVDGIQAWAAQETERIRREASQRTDKRRKELEAHLAKHESIIDCEVVGVGVAVKDYRSTLDDFFDQLRGADNPAELARLAGSLPPPPDLESVRGVARAEAVATFANAPEDAAEDATEDAVAADAEGGADDATEAVADDAVTGETEPGAGEAEPVVADAVESPADAADSGESSDEPAGDQPGIAVMDPDAVGRTADLPAEPAMEAVAVSAQHETAAARFLRSIAPWVADRDHEDRETHQS